MTNPTETVKRLRAAQALLNEDVLMMADDDADTMWSIGLDVGEWREISAAITLAADQLSTALKELDEAVEALRPFAEVGKAITGRTVEYTVKAPRPGVPLVSADQFTKAFEVYRSLLNGKGDEKKGERRERAAPAGSGAEDAPSGALDPRDPDHSRTGIFVYHNCWRCDSGAKPCANGAPSQCAYPYARND